METLLKSKLSYDPETGLFAWLISTRRVKAGHIAGGRASHGYIRITVDGREYYAHRLAWRFVHGEWPELEIDHINGNKADNRISNLRLATRSQNELNTPNKKRGLSGFRGVWPYKGRWSAYITIDGGRRKFLGTYDTPNEAAAIYDKAVKLRHGSFAVLNNGCGEHAPAEESERE